MGGRTPQFYLTAETYMLLYVDYKSDDRLFHIFGPKKDRYFWLVLLMPNGRFNLNLDLRCHSALVN